MSAEVVKVMLEEESEMDCALTVATMAVTDDALTIDRLSTFSVVALSYKY